MTNKFKPIIVKSGIVEIESKDPYMRSFLVPNPTGGNCRVNVWTKGNYYTVGTYLNHPSQGKTQLFRRELTKTQVIDILRNPRQHTGKGYFRKK